jgi:succinoglycan biosynthesis protein ExoA
MIHFVPAKEDAPLRAAESSSEWPFVSIIMPVFNEERFIGRSVEAMVKQTYPAARREILVVDGMSTDGTRAIVSAMAMTNPEIRLLNNPARIVPSGLNRAIAAARGEIVVRLDGHCEYPNDYVRRVVELRQKMGADNVGGVLSPCGTTWIQRAIAMAYCSPAGFAGAALKASAAKNSIRQVDAVHGGCWRRQRLLQAGGFDETMVRNQDDELSFRLRKTGGRICQAMELRVKYHVRDSFGKLFRQFAQYGYWKVRVIRKHPRQASIRHLIPALFVLCLMTLLWSGFLFPAGPVIAAITVGMYFGALAIASMVQTLTRDRSLWPGIVIALAAMHFGYGLGFVAGGFSLVSKRFNKGFSASTR